MFSAVNLILIAECMMPNETPQPAAEPLEYSSDLGMQRTVLDLISWIGSVVALGGIGLFLIDAYAFARYQPTRWMEELMTLRAVDSERLRACGTLLERMSSLALLAGCVAYLRRVARARLWFLAYSIAALCAIALQEVPGWIATSQMLRSSNVWQTRWLLAEICRTPILLVLPSLLLFLTISPRSREAFASRRA